MKRNLTYSLVATALCLMAGAAQAQVQTATNTLNVTGRITQTACSITADPVSMGDVPISNYESSTTGSAIYWKNFNITLSGCQMSTLSSASLSFTGTTLGGDSTTLALTQTTGVAQGFGVKMWGTDGTHGNNAYVNFTGSNSYNYNLASGKNTFQFTANYVKVGSTPKPGTANATATVTLKYA